MNKFRLILLLPLVAIFAACSSTPASRIARRQSAFDSWPLEVREQVSAGRVALGFTAEQVRVALGEPDRVFVRTTGSGDSEVWTWRELGPQFGISVGAGGPPVSGAIGLGFENYDYRDAVRVVFDQGMVAAIETRRR